MNVMLFHTRSNVTHVLKKKKVKIDLQFYEQGLMNSESRWISV